MTAEEIIELIRKKHTSLIAEAEIRNEAGYKRDAIILYRIAEAFVELQNDIGRNCKKRNLK